MTLKDLSRMSYDLRKDTVDMIVAGNGGHIGGDMSVMETLVTLYFDQMNISPENQDDPNRDYFVMSKGHSVEAYYAVLAKKGFLDIREVTEQFSKFGSKIHRTPEQQASGYRDEFRFLRTRTSSLRRHRAGSENGRKGFPCIHRDGRRRACRRIRLGGSHGGTSVQA